MELVSNLLQFIVTLLGFSLSGIRYLKSRKQAYFLDSPSLCGQHKKAPK